MTRRAEDTEGMPDDAGLFEQIEQAARDANPADALDRLATTLAERGDFRALLDALLLKARHDLGLPLIQLGGLAELPEPTRTLYEDRYVAAIREVGNRYLAASDIPAAWPYFRAIAEREPVTAALDAYLPGDNQEALGQVIEVAFHQGAHPRKGFELILENYGACSAISAFESLPPDELTRTACADRLVRHLHNHLVVSLRAEISRRGQPLPREGTSVAQLMEGRDWLFDDDAYHLDVSHLAAVVRLSPLLTDPDTIPQAVALAAYGCHLSHRHKYEGDPPFENVYEDHGVYLRALLGEEVDAAIAHFRAKLPTADSGDSGETVPAQILVRLLVRLGRVDDAISVAETHLAGVPDGALACPSLAQLCAQAGRLDRLARVARERGDLVQFAAAVLQPARPRPA